MRRLAEAWPRRPRPIAPSHTERQRFLRAEDRDLPTWPRKSEVACCTSRRDADGRLPIGYCGPDCERRPA